jgi:hypothetical protein
MTDQVTRTNFNSYVNETSGSGSLGSSAAQAMLDNNHMPNGGMNMDGLAQQVSENLGNESLIADINSNLSPLQQGELARLTDNNIRGEDAPLPDDNGLPKSPNPFGRSFSWDSGELPDIQDDVESGGENLASVTTSTPYSEIHGIQKIGNAPREITFSFELQQTFQSLSNATFSPDGHQEQGGTLYVNIQTGEISISNIGGFGSDIGSFFPNKNLDNTPLGADIGVFHTHPFKSTYDPENGLDGQLSFSATDIYRVVTGEDNFSVLASGNTQYAMVRTAESGTNVSFADFQLSFDGLVQSAREAGMSWTASIRDAVITLTQSFGIAYYEGSGGVLTQVTRSDPPPPPPEGQ